MRPGFSAILPLWPALLFVFAFHFSCTQQSGSISLSNLQPEERAALLISRSLQETITLVPPSSLDEPFLLRYGVRPSWQGQFKTMYEKLRKDLDLVSKDHQQNASLYCFLLNRYVIHAQDSLGNIDTIRFLASPRNPVFMGFSLMAENMPDWQAIGDPVYILSLARSFGVKPWEVYEGIWMCLTSEESSVLHAVAVMVKENLQDKKADSPEFYFRNILVPFLTYLSKGIVMNPLLEQQIFRKFALAFSEENKQNALQGFSMAFKRYVLGAPLEVEHENKLNGILAKHNFRLFMHKRDCVGYRILETRVPISHREIGDVKFVEKVSTSLSMAYLGLSTVDEKDVVLSIDDIREYADDVASFLESGKPFFSFSKSSVSVWNEMKTGVSLDSADLICNYLLAKEFSGLPKAAIVRKFIRQFAVHEVKHKWDEKVSKDTSWFNVDCEISAMLTEIVYGGNPLFSLVNTLYRCQNFYTNINQYGIRDTVRPIIQDLWRCALNIKNGTGDTALVKSKIKEMYGRYVLIRGGKLPSLDDYNTDIVVPYLENLPEIKSKSSY